MDLNHGGKPIPTDRGVFFVAPPNDIGAILSKNSSLTHDEVARAQRPKGGLAGFLSKFRTVARDCTYVGENGLARCLTYDAGGHCQGEELRFPDAEWLWVHETNMFSGGSYRGTTFAFQWVDQNKLLFKIEGSHGSQTGSPPSEHSYHFARAAERAWSEHFLKRCEPSFRSGGVVEFKLKLGNEGVTGRGPAAIYLSKDHIEVNPPAALRTRFRWSREEIGSIDTKGGWIRIRHRDSADSAWSDIKEQGRNQFPYGDVSNARVFLALSRMMLHPTS